MKYYLRIISGVRFKRIKKVIDDVSKKTNKNKILIFLDMINCAVRYGTGFHDYNIFAFYNMKHHQRKTYVTRVINKKVISLCNDKNFSYIFDKKNIFNEKFKKYLNREFLDLEKIDFNVFKKFMKNKEIIFAKPNIGESGKGIERLIKSDFSNLKEMYEYIINKNKNFGVIEELIVQHKLVNKLYPLAINSLRIVTIVADNIPHVVYAVFKMGNEGKFVDNLENSGIFCPIDMETGKINGLARSSKLINYSIHPYTNIKLIGYQLPYINEALELVKKAALEIKEIKYVGWDVAITENGPSIIEGNDYPGYDFWQLPEHTSDKIGLLPYYKKLLPELAKKGGIFNGKNKKNSRRKSFFIANNN